MRDVTLLNIFDHHITQKFVKRSGLAHAIAVAYHAFRLAKEYNEDVDIATKAGFLHDIGHFTWYRNGKWDYELYRQNDIHPIKGAERAHKLLIRLGENPIKAKATALAVFIRIPFYRRTTLNGPHYRKSLNGQMKRMKKKGARIITAQLMMTEHGKALSDLIKRLTRHLVLQRINGCLNNKKSLLNTK